MEFVNRRFNLQDRRFIMAIAVTSISSEIPIQSLKYHLGLHPQKQKHAIILVLVVYTNQASDRKL